MGSIPKHAGHLPKYAGHFLWWDPLQNTLKTRDWKFGTCDNDDLSLVCGFSCQGHKFRHNIYIYIYIKAIKYIFLLCRKILF